MAEGGAGNEERAEAAERAALISFRLRQLTWSKVSVIGNLIYKLVLTLGCHGHLKGLRQLKSGKIQPMKPEFETIGFHRDVILPNLDYRGLADDGWRNKVIGGLYTAHKSDFIPASAHDRFEHLETGDKFHVDTEVDDPCLFGGYWFAPHFGHFVMESLGRLWAYSDVKDFCSRIVFCTAFGSVEKPSFSSEIFQGLGIDTEIVVYNENVLLKKAFVCHQHFGLGWTKGGTNIFRSFIKRSNLISNEQPTAGRRIYISRSMLSLNSGGIAGERYIQKILEKHGYEPYYPEHDTVHSQSKTYVAATEIISIAGSALHFLGLCAHKDQKICIIPRHPGENSCGVFADQIEGLSGRRPLVANPYFIKCSILARGHGAYQMFIVPDMTLLWTSLSELGMVDGELDAQSLEELRSEIGSDMVQYFQCFRDLFSEQEISAHFEAALGMNDFSKECIGKIL